MLFGNLSQVYSQHNVLKKRKRKETAWSEEVRIAVRKKKKYIGMSMIQRYVPEKVKKKKKREKKEHNECKM